MIRRSILNVLLCFPIRLAGPSCSPGPWCHFLIGDGVRARVRADTLLCLGHEVAGQPRRVLVVWALMPPPRLEVAICGLGNFWLGARVRIPRLPGPRSINQLANLD